TKLDRLGLYFNSPEPAIICKECGYAITADKDRVSRHLGEIHQVDKPARRGLNKLVRSLNLPDPKDLCPRPDGSIPHPHLKDINGSACKFCGIRSTSDVVLESHLRKSHAAEIKLAGKSGHRWLRDHIQRGLLFQSWMAQGVHRSWTVRRDDSQTPARQVNTGLLLQKTPDPVKNFAQQLLAEERERLDRQVDQRAPHDASGSTSSTLFTNWMRRTGWQTTFGEARRDILVSLSALPYNPDRPLRLGDLGEETLYSPARQECRLVLMVAALDRLFDRCADTVRRSDVCLRRWLRGTLPDRPYKSPFELVSRRSSERTYRAELKRFLCFWLRVFQLSPSAAKAVLGRRPSRPQRQVLSQLWSDPIWEVEGSRRPDNYEGGGEDEDEGENSEEGEDEDADDDDDDDEDEEEVEYEGEDDDMGERGSDDDDEPDTSTDRRSNEQEVRLNDPAVDVLLRFGSYAMTEGFEDGTASSTMLVYFSAVRSLSSPNGDEYLQPNRFTPILARLIYCMRLILLESVLPCRPHSYVSIPSRPRYSQLKALNAIRTENMCDGTLSPMGEFLSLLSYGHILRRSQGPAIHFHWSDDGKILSWDGIHQLSMENFRGLARTALEAAIVRCKRLMYEWDPDEIDLRHIRDRISTTTQGYSFVMDPANGLESLHLDLFMRACISPIDGLLKTHSKHESTWDFTSAQSYLVAHDDLLRTLMVLMNLDGGQSARISELLTLEHCNSLSQPRGICVWGAKVCSITRYHKARLATNNEFYVARFFSPVVSRLIVRYLVYIRPVAYSILRKCFQCESAKTLFFTPTSQGQPSSSSWTTSTFTQELRRCCALAPGVPPGIGTQLYRHVSIAITERHVSSASSPFNRFDDRTGQAAQDVAYAWQSGHRPMQRHVTYGLDGAFPDHLQPSLLRIYERVSRSWHAFL
ncbi:hypothetical protein B0J13DRAFT_403719, partial [Dactylonectria estremocensis]